MYFSRGVQVGQPGEETYGSYVLIRYCGTERGCSGTHSPQELSLPQQCWTEETQVEAALCQRSTNSQELGETEEKNLAHHNSQREATEPPI